MGGMHNMMCRESDAYIFFSIANCIVYADKSTIKDHQPLR